MPATTTIIKTTFTKIKREKKREKKAKK